MDKKAKEYLYKLLVLTVIWIVLNFIKQLNDYPTVALIARIANDLFFVPYLFVGLDFLNAYQDYEYWMISEEKRWFYFSALKYLHIALVILYTCKTFNALNALLE